MVGDVKGGVVALDLRQGGGLGEELLLDLPSVPQLDGDVGPVGAGEVDGGGGPQDVEGDAVVLGQDGHPGGADLIGGVPVGGHPVAAHEAGVDLPLLHDQACHIVADEGAVHPRPLELVGGEPGSLEEGPGLVHPGV